MIFNKVSKTCLALFLVLSLVFSITPPAQAAFTSTFPDVASTNSFYSHIHNLKEYGIINGYADGSFGADNTLTRGEMSKFVRNAIFGKDYTNTSCSNFSDNLSNSKNTFYAEIQTLKCEGVVNGYSDGLFHPERSVSRGEATKFVVNGLRKKYKDEGFLTPNENGVKVLTYGITDVNSSNTFYEYIASVISYKLMENSALDVPGGPANFYPNDSIKRQEMAELVWNGMQMRNLKENLVSVTPKNLDTNWWVDITDEPLCFLTCTGATIYTIKNTNNEPDSKIMIVENKNAVTDKQYSTHQSLSTKYLNIDSSLDKDIEGVVANIDELNVVYPNTDKVRGGYFTPGSKSANDDRNIFILITATKGDDVITISNSVPGFSCSKGKTTEQCVSEFRLDTNLKAQAKTAAQDLINTFSI